MINQLEDKPYIQLLNRLGRRYRKLKGLKQNILNNETAYRDELYAFFQDCYHLRDWLVQSKAVKSHEVDKFIQDSTEMSMCRHLCLEQKHLIITTPSKNLDTHVFSFAGSALVREWDYFNNQIYEELFILAGGKHYKALEFVSVCLRQWKKFLKERSLI